MKNKTIYWANLSKLTTSESVVHSLLKDIASSQPTDPRQNDAKHINCPAIRNKHLNTFFSTIPYDINVKFDKNVFMTSDTGITSRPGVYENSYAFDWNIQRIFFSEESQIMEVSPAFLHKTSYSQFGHAPSGAFDISKWFRPSSPTFQLWSGETTFQAKKGEAHLYFNFPSQNQIVLQQFKMSENLNEIMQICLGYKFIKPKQSLSAIYEMFTKTKLNQKIIQEIQRNLI